MVKTSKLFEGDPGHLKIQLFLKSNTYSPLTEAADDRKDNLLI